MPEAMKNFIDVLPEYRNIGREIAQTSISKGLILKHLLGACMTDSLKDKELKTSTEMIYINPLEKAKAKSNGQKVDPNRLQSHKYRAGTHVYSTNLKLDEEEYLELEKSLTVLDKSAVENFRDFYKDKMNLQISSLIEGIETDILLQKPSGSAGIDSIITLSGNEKYADIDPAQKGSEFWKGHHSCINLTIDELMMFDTDQSKDNVLLLEFEEFLSNIPNPHVAFVGANAFKLFRRSINRIGSDSGVMDDYSVIHWSGIKIVKVNHEEWNEKKNLIVVLGKDSLWFKTYTEKMHPKNFNDFRLEEFTTDSYYFIADLFISLGIRNRQGMGQMILEGISATDTISIEV